jgi:hypothetical protein
MKCSSRESYIIAVVRKNLVLGGHSLCIELSINISFNFIRNVNSYFVRVTLATRALAIRVFAYPQFYFGITRSINILSAATVEAAAQAH